MQREADATAEPLISIAEAAREVGINKSTLSRQVLSKAVRSHDGKVKLSEVLEDRANNINQAQSRRRPAKSGKKPAASGKNPSAPKPAAGATKPASDATGEDDAPDETEIELPGGEILTFVFAQRVKETYLARLRQLEFRRRSGELVDRAAAEQLFFNTARENRDAWLSWPARIATLMAADLKIEEPLLLEVLTRYVHQHLAELGEPAAPEFRSDV